MNCNDAFGLSVLVLLYNISNMMSVSNCDDDKIFWHVFTIIPWRSFYAF